MAAVLVPNLFRHDPRDLTVAIHGDDFVEVTSLTTWTASWRTLSRSSVSKELELALVMKDTC